MGKKYSVLFSYAARLWRQKEPKEKEKKIMQYQMRNLECQIFSINQTNSLINERSSSRHFFAPKNFCSRAGVSIKSLSLSHFFSCVGKTFFVVLPWEYFGHFYHFLFEIRAFLLVLLLHSVLKSQKVSSLQHCIHTAIELSFWVNFLFAKKTRKFKWDIICSFWNTVFFCGFSRYIFHVRLFFVVVKNPIFF